MVVVASGHVAAWQSVTHFAVMVAVGVVGHLESAQGKVIVLVLKAKH